MSFTWKYSFMIISKILIPLPQFQWDCYSQNLHIRKFGIDTDLHPRFHIFESLLTLWQKQFTFKTFKMRDAGSVNHKLCPWFDEAISVLILFLSEKWWLQAYSVGSVFPEVNPDLSLVSHVTLASLGRSSISDKSLWASVSSPVQWE